MPTPGYEAIKQLLVDTFALPKDAIHVYVGIGCLVVAVVVLRIGISSYRALLPGIVVSVALELLDLGNTGDYPAAMRWGGALRDLVTTNLAPYLVVVAARLGPRGTPSQEPEEPAEESSSAKTETPRSTASGGAEVKQSRTDVG